MTLRAYHLLFVAILCLPMQVSASQQSAVKEAIGIIDSQLLNSTNKPETAKLYCYRARNFAKLQQTARADADYNRALQTHRSGWLLKEYGFFLYHTKAYQKANTIALEVLKDFPYLEKEATLLKKQSEEELVLQEQLDNPPVIELDAEVDHIRVTRHDLIRKIKPKKVVIVSKSISSPSKKSPEPAKPKRRST